MDRVNVGFGFSLMCRARGISRGMTTKIVELRIAVLVPFFVFAFRFRFRCLFFCRFVCVSCALRRVANILGFAPFFVL